MRSIRSKATCKMCVMLEQNSDCTDVCGQTEVVSGILLPQLDLTMIKFKLLRNEEGKLWTPEQVEHMERLYRMFLELHIRYPNRTIVPTKMIDAFWHQHILDTRKYAQDCQVIFGFFLHHFPYFGLRGEDDAANLARTFSETEELFLSEFGISLDVKVNSSRCADCYGDISEAAYDSGVKPVSQLANHLSAKPTACASGCSSCSAVCQ
jgi:hypothetical protein